MDDLISIDRSQDCVRQSANKSSMAGVGYLWMKEKVMDGMNHVYRYGNAYVWVAEDKRICLGKKIGLKHLSKKK